ncbi:FdhF/YdeP family oxidoreductase [bacterium]|nr:FdhF/YdeP family oxidoreductase [bacterium]
MKPVDAGGGWRAIAYAFRVAWRVGPVRLWRAMRSRNACKTCAVGMGGQAGGMRNELGHFPEFCKKSLQAMAADMQAALADAWFAAHPFLRMEAMSPRELEAAGRLATPLYAGPHDDRYRPISWDEALARIANKLRDTKPDETFFYFSGRSSNEAGFLLQLFARVYGTNHVNNCSYYCHQASGVGLAQSFGTGTATVELADIERADTLFLIGGNPASNHPRLMATMARLRRRGGNVVVVNPVREPALVRFRVPSDWWSLLFGSDIASLYVQPNIGGDIAFFVGVAKAILARGAIDIAFIREATAGWDETRAIVEAANWDDIVAASGVARETIERAADIYANARAAVFAWTMGITHHEHGVENVRWIANLALMRGMVGRRHAGLLPIRGHSNVQGIGTVGVTPALKKAVIERFADYGVPVPAMKGFDTMACVEAAHEGKMRAAIGLGGNLYGSNPDSAYAREALSKIDLVAYLSTSLNTGHAHGRGKETIVLPVAARDEESQATTQESMFNFVRLSDGGPRRHPGTRTEVEVIAQLGRRVLERGGPLDWNELADHRNIRRWIARLVPEMSEVAAIDDTKREFTIPGRVYHTPRFSTGDGRARFAAHPIPQANGDARLRLMTVRSEGQFNTVVFEEEDIYRGQERRDVVLLSREDMARLSISTNAWVTVQSDTGRARVLARPFDIRPGNALMYYPEANGLTARRVDPQSRTPAFKNTRVTVRAEGTEE